MPIVITSDFPNTPTPEVLDLFKGLGPDPQIAWIPPFSELARERLPLARQQFARLGLDHLEYFDIDFAMDREGLQLLSKCEVIYLSGGDPIRFRNNLMNSGAAETLATHAEQGRLLMGASGGAMQLTQNVSLFRLQRTDVDEVVSERDSYNALGLVDYELLPHFNRSENAFLGKVASYSAHLSHEIVALADGGAIIEAEGEKTIIGNHARFRAGERYN